VNANIEGKSGDTGLHARTNSIKNGEETKTLRTLEWIMGGQQGDKEQTQK